MLKLQYNCYYKIILYIIINPESCCFWKAVSQMLIPSFSLKSFTLWIYLINVHRQFALFIVTIFYGLWSLVLKYVRLFSSVSKLWKMFVPSSILTPCVVCSVCKPLHQKMDSSLLMKLQKWCLISSLNASWLEKYSKDMKHVKKLIKNGLEKIANQVWEEPHQWQ